MCFDVKCQQCDGSSGKSRLGEILFQDPQLEEQNIATTFIYVVLTYIRKLIGQSWCYM